MPSAYDEAYGVNPQPDSQPQPIVQPQPQPQPVLQPPQPVGTGGQSPQPVAAGQAGGVLKYHVHHSYIWLGTIRSTLAVLFVLMVTSFSSIAALVDEIGYSGIGFVGAIIGGAGLLFLVFVGLVVLVHVLAYKHLYYTLGPNEFSLYSGIITKKRVHVPYDRVQSVDAHASLIQRIFGVRNVAIDTAGGAANKAVLVPYLTKAQAEWLTAELYARKRQTAQPAAVVQQGTPAAVQSQQTTQGNVLDLGKQAWDEAGGVFAGAPMQEVVPSFEYGLTNKQLFLAGLSNNTSFALLILGFIAVIGQVLEFAGGLFPDQTDMAFNMLEAQASSSLAGATVAFSVSAVLVVLAIIWVLSALGNCISYGGFRARRVGDRIEVERGLLQHQRQSISIQRVQAVVVKQSVIRRLIGYCEVSLDKVDAAGSDEQQQNNGLNANGMVVHPFCKLADVPGILEGLVPEYAGIPQDRTALPKVALRRGIIRRCIIQGGGFWMAVVIALVQLLVNAVLLPMDLDATGALAADDAIFYGWVNNICFALYAIAVLIFIGEAISAVRWARESGFAVNRQYMKVINGGLSREERSFLRSRIQYGRVRTNPFQRAAQVATISARTAAGVGGTSVVLWDVSASDADAWLRWLEPGGNREQ